MKIHTNTTTPDTSLIPTNQLPYLIRHACCDKCALCSISLDFVHKQAYIRLSIRTISETKYFFARLHVYISFVYLFCLMLLVRCSFRFCGSLYHDSKRFIELSVRDSFHCCERRTKQVSKSLFIFLLNSGFLLAKNCIKRIFCNMKSVIQCISCFHFVY